MDKAQEFRAPRALWLALVAVALGIACFLCGGVNSASAANLLPDSPPAVDASVSVPPTSPVPDVAAAAVEALVVPSAIAAPVPAPIVSAVPIVPAVPAESGLAEAAVAPGGEVVQVLAETVVADSSAVAAVIESSGAPIVIAVVVQVPPLALPAVTIQTAILPPITVTISTTALPTVGVSSVTTPATTAPTDSSVPAARTSSDRSSAASVQNDRVTTEAVVSLTHPDAEASAARDPLGAPGHPVNLPQRMPATAAADGIGAVSLLSNSGSVGGASVVAARHAAEDDDLPSSLATEPGSSPA